MARHPHGGGARKSWCRSQHRGAWRRPAPVPRRIPGFVRSDRSWPDAPAPDREQQGAWTASSPDTGKRPSGPSAARSYRGRRARPPPKYNIGSGMPAGSENTSTGLGIKAATSRLSRGGLSWFSITRRSRSPRGARIGSSTTATGATAAMRKTVPTPRASGSAPGPSSHTVMRRRKVSVVVAIANRRGTRPRGRSTTTRCVDL